MPYKTSCHTFDNTTLVGGKVIGIANDFVLLEGKPVFKVKCRLDRQRLQLKNGYPATLKKGMTLRARFVVAERTLFQLLCDNADDWLNPALVPESSVQ